MAGTTIMAHPAGIQSGADNRRGESCMARITRLEQHQERRDIELLAISDPRESCLDILACGLLSIDWDTHYKETFILR